MLLIFSLPSSILYTVCFAGKRPWELRRSTEAPLSHRNQCSWNASSELPPPLIPWLCDITLRHTFANHCPTASLKNWFSTAALFMLAVLGQACVSWPIRGGWVFRRRSLKETGAKTDGFRQRMCFLSIKAYKHILSVTQNKITNLKISRMCPLI